MESVEDRSPYLVNLSWVRNNALDVSKMSIKRIIQTLSKSIMETTVKVNVIQTDGNDFDSSVFLLSINPGVCHADVSEWVLDRGATNHVCPK